jgi:hypothetical protein
LLLELLLTLYFFHMVKSYQEQLNDLYDQLKNKEISLEKFYDLCFELETLIKNYYENN